MFEISTGVAGENLSEGDMLPFHSYIHYGKTEVDVVLSKFYVVQILPIVKADFKCSRKKNIFLCNSQTVLRLIYMHEHAVYVGTHNSHYLEKGSI